MNVTRLARNLTTHGTGAAAPVSNAAPDVSKLLGKWVSPMTVNGVASVQVKERGDASLTVDLRNEWNLPTGEGQIRFEHINRGPRTKGPAWKEPGATKSHDAAGFTSTTTFQGETLQKVWVQDADRMNDTWTVSKVTTTLALEGDRLVLTREFKRSELKNGQLGPARDSRPPERIEFSRQ